MFVRMNIVQNGLAMTTRSVKTDDELLAEIAEEVKDHEDGLLNDYKTHVGSWKYHYLYLCIGAKNIVSGKFEQQFNVFMIFAIIAAGILVGIQCYPELENDPIVTSIENAVIALFFLECVLKILAEGLQPYKYFIGKHGRMNTFDFLIVILCAPFISDIFVGKSPIVRLVSRLFRLVRISKLANQIPSLQVILRGLAGGLKSITYIAIFLVLVLYVYAIFGVILFYDNDPFHFRSIHVSLLTLFQCCTLENWSEIMYINIYGCRDYPSTFLYSESDIDPQAWADLNDMYKCTKPIAQPVVASIYMLSYVIIASFIMLSLFVGIVTMNMQDSLNEMRTESENAVRKNRLLKQAYEMKVLTIKAKTIMGKAEVEMSSHRKKLTEETVRCLKDVENPNLSSKRKSSVLHLVVEGAKKTIEVARETTRIAFTRASVDERKKMDNIKEMRKLLAQAWEGAIAHDMDHHIPHDAHELILKIANQARKITSTEIFSNVIVLVIFLTAILVGLEIEDRSDQYYGTYNILEEFIFYVFLVEILVRWAADEFHIQFFMNFSNVFDLLVTVGSKIRAEGNFIIMLRIFRLFRVFKLTKSIPQLGVIINALITAIMSIGYVLCVIFLYYYIFAILGVTMFGQNDEFYFGSLHTALAALFQIATLDNWSQVMYKNVYGCDVYPPFLSLETDLYGFCPHPEALGLWAVLYFVVFVTIGAFVMLTLFVGVVTTSMDEASKNQIVEMALNVKVNEACDEQGISEEQLGLYRRVFNMLDFDGGGSIEAQELKLGLNCINVFPTEDELDKWILEVDIDKSGAIDMVEFVTFMTNIKKKKEQERLAKQANVIAKKLLLTHRRKRDEGRLKFQKPKHRHFNFGSITLMSPLSFRRGGSVAKGIGEASRWSAEGGLFKGVSSILQAHKPAPRLGGSDTSGGSMKHSPAAPQYDVDKVPKRRSMFGSLTGAFTRQFSTTARSNDFVELFKERKKEKKSLSMKAFAESLRCIEDDEESNEGKESLDDECTDTDDRLPKALSYKQGAQNNGSNARAGGRVHVAGLGVGVVVSDGAASTASDDICRRTSNSDCRDDVGDDDTEPGPSHEPYQPDPQVPRRVDPAVGESRRAMRSLFR